MGCVGSRVDIEADGRQYHIKRLIANGGFSQIFNGEDLETGEKVAIKKITCHSTAEINRTYREIELHRRFGGASQRNDGKKDSKVDDTELFKIKGNLMPIIGFYEEKPMNFSSNVVVFSLVFPLCKMGSMQDELTNRRATKDYISQQRVLHLFRQTCLALEALHKAKPPVAHRDLKPANLLLYSEDHLVLTDFGSATDCPIRIDDAKQRRSMLDESSELCTMPYRAPELFTCETGTIIDESVDIWSLGCVLYAFCFFCSPFDEVHERGDSIALAVQSARLKFEADSPFDDSLKTLISWLVNNSPSKRPRISEILQRLETF